MTPAKRTLLALGAAALLVLTAGCSRVSVTNAAARSVQAVRAALSPPKAGHGDRPWRLAFSDAFASDLVVKEATTPTKSVSPDWWLSSGGNLIVRDGVASTYVGEAPAGYYRDRYALRNPVDTDGGRYPQNLLRLLTTKSWTGDVRAQSYFRILDYHLTDSPQRYDPNGLLLFSRYGDSQDLYYAGIRVDGHAVIKKKRAGSYYTLFEKKVFAGTYDRTKNPILLPRNRWIGLRSETVDNADGSVTVSLYMDADRTGKWQLLIRGTDAGVNGPPMRGTGHVGIRTDFMDVQFDDYSVSLGR